MITSHNDDPWDASREYHNIFMLIANLFVYRYFEYIYSIKINIKRLVTILLPSLLFLVTYIYAFLNYSPVNPQWWLSIIGSQAIIAPYFVFFLDLQTLLVWIWGSYVSIKILQNFSRMSAKIESVLLLITSLSATIASALELSEHFVQIKIEGNTAFLVPFVLMIFLFVYNPYFSYTTPYVIEFFELVHVNSGKALITSSNPDKSRIWMEKLPNFYKFSHSLKLNNNLFKISNNSLIDSSRNYVEDNMTYVRFKENNYVIECIYSKEYLIYIVLMESSEAIRDGLIRFYQSFFEIQKDTSVLNILVVKKKRILRILSNCIPLLYEEDLKHTIQ